MPRLSSLVLKTLAGLGITLPAGGGINWGSTLNVTLAHNVYNVNGYIYAALGFVTDTTDAYSIIGGTRENSQNSDFASYGKIYIIDNNTGSIVREHIGTAKLSSSALEVAISDNYYAIATALFNQDMVLRVYDIATGSLQYSTSLGAFQGTSDHLITMNDNYIMISNGTTGPRIYDTASGTQIAAPAAPSGVSSWGGTIVFDESRMAIRGQLAAAGYQGRVDVFEMSAGFPYLYSILAPIAGGQFGKNTDKAIAVTGSHIIISNRSEYSNKGRVYIYDATDGSLLHTLVPPASPYSDYFGHSVAANDNYLAVGTPNHDAFGVGGYAHLYNLTTGGLVAALSTPGNYPSGTYPMFGRCVSISEHRLVVGADNYMVNGSTPVGAGFVYNLYDIL
jgi:WD40 repeat protein